MKFMDNFIKNVLILIIFCFLTFFTSNNNNYSSSTTEAAKTEVTPKFLWTAINISLTENRVPWYCPKIVFYTNDTTIISTMPSDSQQSFGNPKHGNEFNGIIPNVFININLQSIKDGNWNEWLNAEEQLHLASLKLIHQRLDPCVVVISFVFNYTELQQQWQQPQSQEQSPTDGNMEDDIISALDSQAASASSTTTTTDSARGRGPGAWAWNYPDPRSIKYKLRHQMTDLFQYSTPVKTRYLSLVRLTKNRSELRVCSKAPKYPLRLVPLWERILYDFFNEAFVIQGLYYDEKSKPFITMNKEYGKWKWLCEDIVERLELEQRCAMDHSCLINANPEYYEKLWTKGGRPKLKGDLNYCKLGYKARH